MDHYKTIHSHPPYTVYRADTGAYGLWHGTDGWLINPYATKFSPEEVEAIYKVIVQSQEMRSREVIATLPVPRTN